MYRVRESFLIPSFTSLSCLCLAMAQTFILLFVAYGVAFDPKNGQLFGPIMAPIFVGFQLGMNLFAGAGMSTAPGCT